MHVEFVALSTLHLLPIKICRNTFTPVTDTSTKLYTRPNLSARMGCSLLGTACDEPWDKSRLSVGSDKTRVLRRTFNLTPLQLPLSLHFPGAAAQPELYGVMSTAFTH